MTNLIVTVVFLSGLSFSSLSFAKALEKRSLIAKTESTKIHLLELYTSESCSSCPPTEERFSKLRNNPLLWTNFVPVQFHVDYWNYLDWKDEFSTHEMTQRQVDLTNLWSVPRVYTPAVIIDGKESPQWSGSVSAKEIPNKNKEIFPILAIYKNADGSLQVECEIKTTTAGKKYKLRVAKLGMNLSTQVTSGENSGKKLTHDFLVLAWLEKAWDGTKSSFKIEFPATSKKTSDKNNPLAVAAWVETQGSPIPLQAVGGEL